MRKQRGFVIEAWMYAVAAIIILALISSLIWWADSHIATSAGVAKGEANINEKWANANREAEAEAKALKEARQIEADKSAAHLEAANAAAADYYDAWRKANAANRKPLASCGPANPAPSGQTGVANLPADSGGNLTLRLTTEFVRQYDAAWTGADGKPVFSDSGLPPDEASGAATPAEVLATHAANAERCSKDRRRQNELIDLLLKLRAG